ncbi:MAG: hypothetical protein D3923_01865 [Candidatus Electrothrix sp. AR3]|nr:hypothetical protein [Candidatus Electrothrix sp. AR3]
MDSVRICPVCGRHGLAAGGEQCPQCDADLTCFQALDSLSSKNSSVKTAKFGRKFTLTAVVFLLAITALVLAGMLVNMRKNMRELDQRLTELKSSEQQQGVAASSSPETNRRQDTENMTRIKEDLTASSGKIYQVDARIRIVDTLNPPQSLAATEAMRKAVVKQEQAEISETSEPKKISTVPPSESVDARKAVVKQEQQAEVSGKIEAEELPSVVQKDEFPQEMVKKTTADSVDTKKTPEEEQAAKNMVASSPKEIPTLTAERIKQAVKGEKNTRKRRRSKLSQPKQLPVLKDSPGNTFLYQARDTETLWDIAQRFYGSGKYYPVIIEQNPQLRISNINSKSLMRLLYERELAAAIYARKKDWKNDRLLWKYEIRPGDTKNSIYARFFPPDYAGRIFYSKKPNIVPGNTVRIILP